MYSIKNGIMYKNGKPMISIGTSYYASYHPEKVTVPEGGDKVGEMKKDIRQMAEAGFTHVRTAAIGKSHWEGDVFCQDTDFTDQMIEEAANHEMATFVRLQGYSMNHRGHEDAQPLNQEGQAVPMNSFVQDTLNHPALNADMDEATRQQALHYAKSREMLGFQIYNEPAMSSRAQPYLFDYHPMTIAAWRKWLVEKGYNTPEEAENMNPPTALPAPGEDVLPYAHWRQFGVENMDAMLCRLNRCAKEAVPASESFTNYVATPVGGQYASCEGDWFGGAKGMDIVGLDLYSQLRGMQFYWTACRLDCVESAAAAQGKHAWIIEYCCRTHMTVQDYEREMMAAIGSGYKGVNYYLWRGDYCGPEIQLGGMIWNNREKTEKYDESVKVNFLVNRWGEQLARCEKLRSGAAILYSLHGAAYCEAADGYGPNRDNKNRWYQRMHARYDELKRAGVTADFIQAEDLERNPLGIKVLFVPYLDAMDEREKAQVSAFARNHPVILDDNRFHPDCGNEMNGYDLISNWCFRTPGTLIAYPQNMHAQFRLPEILEMADVQPKIRAYAKNDALSCQPLLEQNAEKPLLALSLININTNGAPLEKGCVEIDADAFPAFSRCIYADRHCEKELALEIRDGVYRIPISMEKDIAAAFLFLFQEK